jgi:hypothetical protein
MFCEEPPVQLCLHITPEHECLPISVFLIAHRGAQRFSVLDKSGHNDWRDGITPHMPASLSASDGKNSHDECSHTSSVVIIDNHPSRIIPQSR